MNNEGLSDVIFGLSKASLVKVNLSSIEERDLAYALLILKHMTGVSLKFFRISLIGSYYVYDEDYLRSIADKGLENSFASTRLGLSS